MVVIKKIRMNKLPVQKSIWQVLLMVFLLAWGVLVQANDILEEVSFTDKGKEVEIKAKISLPFDYVKHFPSKRGKIIQIQLKVDQQATDKKKTKRRETIRPPTSAPLQIRDVIFEGNVRGGPYLVIRFKDVVKFRVEEVKNSQAITILVEKDKSQTVKPVAGVKPEVKDEKLMEVDQLMRDARVALTNGKNGDAILLFTKLLSMHEHKHLMDAKEYLGLARERNGQLEMAKKEYEDYLKLYPKERRANTVKQRLMTLNARLARPKKQLKESKRTLALRKKEGLKRTDIFGRFSQIYYTAFISKENTSFEKQQSLLLSFFDTSWRQRDAEKETRLVFSGSHEEDFDNTERESRIRSLYGDYKGKKNGLHATVGRQSVNSGGVLGRFDGGVLGFRIKPKYRGYLVGGYPVDFIDNLKLQTNKPMLGGRVDMKEVIPHWQTSAYAIHQWVDSITNRFAVGADARYFHKKKIFYSLVDYDVSYDEMNFLTLHYGWQLNEKTKVDVHFDRRRSPVMLTSNAIQGLSSLSPTILNASDSVLIPQLGDDVTYGELKTINKRLSIQSMIDAGMTEDEIRQRAKDNTGRSTLITLSVRRNLKKDLELNGNLTINRYEPGKNFDDIEKEKDAEDEEEGNPKDTSFISLSTWDKVLYAQLIQRNYFKPRDILIGGLRYSNNKTSLRYETNATVRYPFKKKWWIDLKMRFMYTTNKEKEKDAARANPKVRIEYRYNKKLTLEGDVGTEINKSQIQGEDYTWTSGNLGFRYLF